MQLILDLLDHYGHRVTAAPPLLLGLAATSTVKYQGNQVIPLSKGLFNYSELIVYASPASTQVLAVLTDSAENFLLQGQVSLSFRDCVAGEIRRTDRCEICHTGNFSLSPSDENCNFCPSHAFCSGGSEIILDKGYWRNNSIVPQKCPFLNSVSRRH